MTETVEQRTDDADPDTAAAPAPGTHRRGRVAELAEGVLALVTSFNRAKTRMLAQADVERVAHVLLRCLDHEGPLRLSALAECMHADPSTVSRQVAALVKDGLLERRADPADGRASLLVLTDRAREVLEEYNAIRLNYFEQMLAEWSDADLQRFSRDVGRFTDAYVAAHTTVLDRLSGRQNTGSEH